MQAAGLIFGLNLCLCQYQRLVRNCTPVQAHLSLLCSAIQKVPESCVLAYFFNFFPASYNLSSALLSAYVLIANNMDLDQTASKGSDLNRVHSVCFHEKI